MTDHDTARRDNRVQFRVDPETMTWLDQRTDVLAASHNLSTAVQRELSLWRLAMSYELQRTGWTIQELCLLADVASGALLDDSFGSNLAYQLQDAIAYYPGVHGQKWDLDEGQLLAKVANLGPVADHAMRVAIARFWAATDKEARDPATWQELGLRTIAAPTSPRGGIEEEGNA